MQRSAALPALSCFLDRQQLRLHYRVSGSPSSPAVILVHGGMDHCRTWDEIAENLSSEYQVITPDLRGHGDSGWASDGHYRTDADLCDLAKLIETRKLEKVSIVGHSRGGDIALRFSSVFPDMVERVVAIEGTNVSLAERDGHEARPIAGRLRTWICERMNQEMRPERRFKSVEDAAQRIRLKDRELNESAAYHLALHGLRKNHDGTFSWKFDPMMKVQPILDISSRQLAELWRNISCPVLLIRGSGCLGWSADPRTDGRYDDFRHARIVTFPCQSHLVHLVESKGVYSCIREFLGKPELD